MRLFTAILFDEDTKNSLSSSLLILKSSTKSGTFTSKENFHLTVNFIGETKRLDEVKKAMEQAVERAGLQDLSLEFKSQGKFKRREGDIYWIGVEKNEALWKLQKQMVKNLKDAGFYDIDDLEYRPHITLGRRIQLKESAQVVEFGFEKHPLKMRAAKLSLMKSERIQGKLVYTEIYQVHFNENIVE